MAEAMFSRDANRSLDVWWRARYDTLKAHLDGSGGMYPAQGDATGLGRWIADQRTAYKRPEGDDNRLSAKRNALLEQLPRWTWEGRFKRPAESAPE